VAAQVLGHGDEREARGPAARLRVDPRSSLPLSS
jgi:hypothetical protein